jgi:HPt (histidine-containing phosphotransfer) domain-containing protein
MTELLGDHFVREAGDYLEELDLLLRGASEPDLERVFRLARGVRGSAQVAGADAAAEVAARLEGAARFVLDGRIRWADELRDRFIESVAELRSIVPAFRAGWSDDEVDRLCAIAERWGSFEHSGGAAERAGPANITEFVQSELATVVGVIRNVARELARTPAATAPPRELLDAIRVVRGVAGSPSLAPVLEVIDGVEDISRHLAIHGADGESARLEALDAAREALESAIRALKSDDAPDPEDPALSRFRARYAPVATPTQSEADVVPIEALFFDDEGPHLVSPPSAARQAGSAEPPAPVARGDDAVPVETLLLRGDRALEAAGELRARLEPALGAAARQPNARSILDELWDLISLARVSGR